MIQRKNHDVSAVKKTSNEITPVQDWSKKPWHASNVCAKESKSIRPKLETWNFQPNSNRTSKIYLKEELQQDVQRFKNEVGMLHIQFQALDKKKINCKKVKLHLY